MDKEAVLTIIYEWQKIVNSRDGVERNIEPQLLSSFGSKPIKIVTGFRRAGKSFLLQRIAKQLIQTNHIKQENLLYLNFEDYRLMGVNDPSKLGELFDVFISDISTAGKKLIIFDEIQNIENWDKFIRTLHEKSSDVDIYLTGSNSELLSSEIGSNLSGRFIEFFLFPFSFDEFLRFNHLNITTEKAYQQNKQAIDKLFAEYIRFGGLPEIFSITDNDARISYLSGIVTKVILDDIVKRFKVSNIDVLEKLFVYLICTIGQVISYTSLKNRLSGLGLKIKLETVITYIDYFTKVFSVIGLRKFSWNQNKIFEHSQKFYAIDPGLLSLYRPIEENYAFRLENIIFLELRRRFKNDCYYGINDSGKEIDFLINAEKRRWDKYQVTLELNEENMKRELDVFALSDKHLEKGKNVLLSLKDHDQSQTYNNIDIDVKNIIKWLLDAY